MRNCWNAWSFPGAVISTLGIYRRGRPFDAGSDGRRTGPCGGGFDFLAPVWLVWWVSVEADRIARSRRARAVAFACACGGPGCMEMEASADEQREAACCVPCWIDGWIRLQSTSTDGFASKCDITVEFFLEQDLTLLPIHTASLNQHPGPKLIHLGAARHPKLIHLGSSRTRNTAYVPRLII